MVQFKIGDAVVHWDENKARLNIKKHLVSFEEAATVFGDVQANHIYDELHSSYEERWQMLGMSDKGRILTVIYVDVSENAYRIISARQSTARERRFYGQQ